jgi:hypothetical protein
VPFTLQNRRYIDLSAHLDFYRENEDARMWHYVQRLLATADGRYDFRTANLNEAVDRSDHVEVEPVRFREWLEAQWGAST